MPVKKLDDRPQAERADQRAQPYQAAQHPAGQRADRVREDTAAKIGHGRVVPQLQRQRVVRGDAKVCRLVERSPQRGNDDRCRHPEQLLRQRRRRAEKRCNGVIERGDDETDADAVDECAKADVLPPHPDLNGEHQEIGGNILHSQRDAKELCQTHIQSADGIVAEM